MPTRYSTATVPHAAYRQLRQHLRFVAGDRPAGATRRRPDSAAHRRTDLRAPRMVKKSCGLPVIVLQEAAPSLLASHFAFAGSHPLFSGSKKQNIYFALMVSLSMVVLGERRYGALLSEHSPNKIKLDKHSSFIGRTAPSRQLSVDGVIYGVLASSRLSGCPVSSERRTTSRFFATESQSSSGNSKKACLSRQCSDLRISRRSD